MARIRLFATGALAACSSLALSAAASAQAPAKQLGKVAFATTCKPLAQAQFNRAMLYQHSFWYRASQRAFEEVLKTDPDCAIAHWGMALSLLWNPHTVPPAQNLKDGAAALERAKAVPAKSQRERDYVDALAEMYKNHETVDHRTRLLAYAAAMEKLAKTYPQDPEAQIHYALALNTSASPADKTFANQLKGAAILEKLAKRLPQHPGIAHYLIHLYDYPAIAAKGLGAARRYAKIAPDAPHALHMPSHVFTRVGLWKDSIASNIKSASAAKESREVADQLHAMDYLVYAHLQLGDGKKAQAVHQDMLAVTGVNESYMAGSYALAASPARIAIERSDWQAARQLAVRPNAMPQVQALTYFARALGAARSGTPADAKADIVKLEDLAKALRDKKDAYWAEQVDIQRQAAAAWVLHAEGKADEAIVAMAAAADAEDKTDKHPVTPGPLAPAREMYATMLLERGKAKEALAAYEATLKKEPNRLLAFVGAGRAAAKAGVTAKARRFYARVAQLGVGVDGAQAAIAEARAFVGKKGKV